MVKVVTAESIQAVLQLIATDIKSKADLQHVHNDYVTTTAFNQAISGINSFQIQVVSGLPTENIDDHTIYLKTIEGEVGNKYEEYLYINGEWELIGNTGIDLSEYALTETVNAQLEGKADSEHTHAADEISWSSTIAATTQTNVKQAIEAVHSHADVELSKKANSADIPTKVSQLENDSKFQTKTEVETAISNAVTGGTIDLSGYVTDEELAGELAKKANSSHTHEISEVNGFQAALDGKANSGHNHTLANITDLDMTAYPKAVDVTRALNEKANASDLTTLRTDMETELGNIKTILDSINGEVI